MLYLYFKTPDRNRLIQMKEKFEKGQFALRRKNEETKFIPIDQIDTALAYQKEGWDILVADMNNEILYNPSLSDVENRTVLYLSKHPERTP